MIWFHFIISVMQTLSYYSFVCSRSYIFLLLIKIARCHCKKKNHHGELITVLSEIGTRYGLHVCVHPKIQVETLTPNVITWEGLGRWLGHDSGALLNRISALTDGTSKSSFSSPPYEDITRKRPPATQKRALTRTWSYWNPNLRLPASRTVRNKSVVYKLPSWWFFVIAAWAD